MAVRHKSAVRLNYGWPRRVVSLAILALASVHPSFLWAQQDVLQSKDFRALRSVSDVQLSPDSTLVAYTVVNRSGPGRPTSQVWVMDLATRRASPIGNFGESHNPRWSPDGKWIAFLRGDKDSQHLAIVRPDGTDLVVLADVSNTNSPLPSPGERVSWSPDGTRLAFVSATPGPETEEASGDPMVITRYLYKPNHGEGLTRFNDNRRLHIFVVDISSKTQRQLTDGRYYEHSIDWGPGRDEILFVSNRGRDPERVFNYDIFAVSPSNGEIRQITRTEAPEYAPRWSPDGTQIAYLGTTRGLTSSETTMEDTHLWLMKADGTGKRELGAAVDNRQNAPAWHPGGTAVYCTVQERGNVGLYRFPIDGSRPEQVIHDRGRVISWSIGAAGEIVYSFHSPADLPQLHRQQGKSTESLSDLNAEILGRKKIAQVESFTFQGYDGRSVEAFLTKPLNWRIARHPLIAMIKGGPHGQQGSEFNFQAQIYAAQGWATLMVNYRGSTGYGQAFADAIFQDQNGGEVKDVLWGTAAALSRFKWLDPDRLGVEGVSYGGQLANWIITQTPQFKAAIPIAGISNLVSFNYMAYYHDYLAAEFGGFPHQDDLMEVLWRRSPLRRAAQVKTPTMLVHGENDNDVPIAEAEQYYIALKDVGVDTVMVRYPREGHGIHESAHIVDLVDRSIAWYRKYF